MQTADLFKFLSIMSASFHIQENCDLLYVGRNKRDIKSRVKKHMSDRLFRDHKRLSVERMGLKNLIKRYKIQFF